MVLAKQGYFYNKLSETIVCHRCQRVINDTFDITHHTSQCMGDNNQITDASNMVTEVWQEVRSLIAMDFPNIY